MKVFKTFASPQILQWNSIIAKPGNWKPTFCKRYNETKYVAIN